MPAQTEALNQFAIGISVIDKNGQLERFRKKVQGIAKELQSVNQMFAKGEGFKQQKDTTKTVVGNANKGRTAVVQAERDKRASMLRSQRSMRDYSNQFSGYNQKLAHSARLNKNEFTDMFRRVALWSTGIGVLFGTISKVKFVFGAVKDLEVQMAELKKVMDDDTPFKTARKSLLDIAQSMSVSVRDAADIAKIWAQQGKNLNETIDLTKTALLGVNSANLTASQSVEFLTSATISFNIEADKTTKIIDGIMAVQANYAITAQNLARGMNVAGATAAQLGDGLGDLFGMMTAVGEVTRETGNVIGNSFKTQMARLQNPATIKFLQSFGIAVKELTDEGVVKRLSAYEIFKQIAAKRAAGKITSDQAIDIALKIGGIRKFKDALILIERFGVAEEARGKYLLAYDDASRASTIIQETLQRKYEKLNTSLISLGDTLSNAGIISGLGGVVKRFTDLSNVLNEFFSGKSSFGDVGKSLATSLPLTLLTGAGIALGKRGFQNARGSLLRDVEYATQSIGTPLGKSSESTLRLFTGANASSAQLTKFANTLKDQNKVWSEHARKMGSNFNTYYRTMAFQQSLRIAESQNLLKFSKGFKGKLGLVLRGAGQSLSPLGGQKIGGAGLIAFGNMIGSLIKGIGKLAVLMIVVDIISRLVSKLDLMKYVFGEEEKQLQTVIDVTSEASKAFEDLYNSLGDVSDGAVTFQTKMDKLQPIGIDLAERIASGQIKTARQLRKVLTDPIDKGGFGFSKQDIKDQRDAQRALLDFGKFFKYELGTVYQQEKVRLDNELSNFLSDLSDTISDSDTKIVDGTVQSSGEIGKVFEFILGRFDDEDKIVAKLKKRGVEEDNTILATVDAIFGTKFKSGEKTSGLFKQSIDEIDNLARSLQKTSYEAAKAGNNLPSSFDELSLLFKDKGLASELAKSIDKSVVDAIESGKAIDADEFKLETLPIILTDWVTDAFKLKRKKVGFVGLPKGGTEDNVDGEVIKRVMGAIQKNVNDYLKGILSPTEWKWIENLNKVLPTEINAIVEGVSQITDAMLSAEDKIFLATSNFVADMQRIQVGRSTSSFLGTNTTPAQDMLKSFEDFVSKASTITVDLEQQKRQYDNLKQRVTGQINNSSDPYMSTLRDAIKNNVDWVKDLNKMKVDLSTEIENAPDAGDRSKGLKKIFQILSELEKTNREINLAEADFTTSVQSWIDLFGLLKGLTGLEIPDQATIKKAFADKNFSIFDKFLEVITADAVDEIGKLNEGQIRSKAREGLNQIRSSYQSILGVGNEFYNSQIKFGLDLAKSNAKYNQEIGYIIDQLDGRSIITKRVSELRADIDRLKIEKQLDEAMIVLNSSMEETAITAGKVKAAFDQSRAALTEFFADVKQFATGATRGEAFRGALNQIVEQRLRHASEQMVNTMMDSIGQQAFGEFILGDKVEDPLQGALDMNTTATMTLTEAINLLNLNMLVGTSQDPFGGFTFSGSYTDKFNKLENRLNELADVEEKSVDKRLNTLKSFATGAGQILGGILGSQFASSLGKENNTVNIGTGIGSMLGSFGENSKGVTDFLGAGLSAMLPGFGSILGGLVGALFGSDKEKEEKDSDNLKRIAENTAALVDIDSRIINAPSDFKLPATSSQGGAIQWTGNIVVNGGGDAQSTAIAVRQELSKMMGRGTSTFNTVNDRLI
jgi:TP901 family phage tail tape measure protein